MVVAQKSAPLFALLSLIPVRVLKASLSIMALMSFENELVKSSLYDVYIQLECGFNI
jgi:hypothetical protein